MQEGTRDESEREITHEDENDVAAPQPQGARGGVWNVAESPGGLQDEFACVARNASCCDADGVRSTARNSRSSFSESSIIAAARATPQTVPQLPYTVIQGTNGTLH